MNLIRRSLMGLSALPTRSMEQIRDSMKISANLIAFQPRSPPMTTERAFEELPEEQKIRDVLMKFLENAKSGPDGLAKNMANKLLTENKPSLAVANRQIQEHIAKWEDAITKAHATFDSYPTHTPDFDAMRAKCHQPELIDALEKEYHDMYKRDLMTDNLLDGDFDQDPDLGMETPEEKNLLAKAKSNLAEFKKTIYQNFERNNVVFDEMETVMDEIRVLSEQRQIQLQESLENLQKQRAMLPTLTIAKLRKMYPEIAKQIEAEVQDFLWDPEYDASQYPEGFPDVFTREAHYGPNAFFHKYRH